MAKKSRAAAPQRADGRNRLTRRQRIGLIAGLSSGLLVVLLAGAVFGIKIYFSDRVHPGVELAGESLDGLTLTEVQAKVAQMTAGRTMTVTVESGDDSVKTLSADPADLGLTVDIEATAQAALAAADGHSIIDAYAPWVQKPVQFVTRLDADQAAAWVKAQLTKYGQPATDASVTFDAAADAFVTTPAASGTAVDPAPLDAALAQWAADPLSEPAVSLTIVEKAPDIDAAAAAQVAAAANDRLTLDVTVTTDVGSYSPSREARIRWTTFQADTAAGSIKIVYDRAAMRAELPEVLEEELTQARVDKAIVTNAAGTTLGVLTDGADGIKLKDEAALINQIADALDQGKALDAVAPTVTDEFETKTEKITDVHGGKWFDVNLSTYRVVAYQGDSAVNSFLVSYGMSGHETPPGLWTVVRQVQNDRMIGEIDPKTGKPEYDTPVQYSTYFTWGGVAFHAAPWVTTFGTNVSHGCVNMTTSDAQWVFNWAEVGVPVYVHW
ncbi:MAG: L,D-transpeptidase [Propionibacteriaceae bacterium]|jgi:lipoprotein-anchoring transpeptidase ErfK/SrfK|nr:L,D-transpeptidase [Propionibacteriaceae bacterium]